MDEEVTFYDAGRFTAQTAQEMGNITVTPEQAMANMAECRENGQSGDVEFWQGYLSCFD